MFKEFLFWSIGKNKLNEIYSNLNLQFYLGLVNYGMWIYLGFVSYVLIYAKPSLFWNLLIAVILGEVLEKILKKLNWWKRPCYELTGKVPVGFLKAWYTNGSFPSGHTLKAVYYFIYLLAQPVFSLPVFLLMSICLIAIRIYVGLHYPIDVLGGVILGVFVWYISSRFVSPEIVTNLVSQLIHFLTPLSI